MERVFVELIRRAHRDYDLVVISSELAPDLRELVEWHRVAVPHRPVPLKFTLFFALAGLRLARTSTDLVHTLGALVPNRADVASVHFCHVGFHEATRGISLEGKPLLRRINTGIARALGRAAERWSYGDGRVRALAAVSRGVARELDRHYPGVPVFVTPNGVDAERFRPDPLARTELRRARSVASRHVIALFVGGDWDHKGLGIAVQGLAHAVDAGADSLRLWVVGRGDETRYRTLASACGVEDRVCFFGFRPDTERFYQAADVLVLPSLYEAFPLVVLEAASSGVPIVATHVNGVEDVVGNDDAGLIVERTPAGVGAALFRLATEPATRARMAAAARQRAREFTWTQSAETTLAVYRRVGSRSSLAEASA